MTKGDAYFDNARLGRLVKCWQQADDISVRDLQSLRSSLILASPAVEGPVHDVSRAQRPSASPPCPEENEQ